MEREKKLAILYKKFDEYGIPRNDEEVQEFFYSQRLIHANQIENIEGYVLSKGVIKYEKISVLPTHFENVGEWSAGMTLFESIVNGNPRGESLLFDYLENPPEDIVESFLELKKDYPVAFDMEGNLFNDRAGDHKLLAIMVHYFAEKKAAKNEEERKKVDDKYRMALKADTLHDKKLVSMLSIEKFIIQEDSESPHDYLVRSYMKEIMGEDNYLATYDKKTKIYKYKYNGDKFEGTAEELLKFLREKKKRPFLMWQKDGIYYLGIANNVIKSSSKENYRTICENVMRQYRLIQGDRKPFMVVRDFDNDLYDIVVPRIIDANHKTGKKIADMYREIMIKNGELFLGEKSDVFIDELLDALKECNYGKPLSIPEIKYTGLTKEEYKELSHLLSKNYRFIQEMLQEEKTKKR